MSEHSPGLDPSAGELSPADGTAHEHSLTDDLRAVFEDGRTYLEAELHFQKSRAAFVADRGRSGAIYGVGALVMIHLALIALVVGLVFALAAELGPWGATAIVVGVLLVAGVVLGLAARKRFGKLSAAFGGARK